jgi:hypothetical protein
MYPFALPFEWLDRLLPWLLIGRLICLLAEFCSFLAELGLWGLRGDDTLKIIRVFP